MRNPRQCRIYWPKWSQVAVNSPPRLGWPHHIRHLWNTQNIQLYTSIRTLTVILFNWNFNKYFLKTLFIITLLPVSREGSNVIYCINDTCTSKHMGWDSSVGVTTMLHAGQSGDRVPVVARFSAAVQTGNAAHSTFCTMGVGSLSGE